MMHEEYGMKKILYARALSETVAFKGKIMV